MIVIPMAGLSQRFTAAGYTIPKYQLRAGGVTLFAHCVGSFAGLFRSHEFLFVMRDIADTPAFVARECAALGLAQWRSIVLTGPTRGQAETVALGLDAAGIDDATPLTIFNIDTLRPGFRFEPDMLASGSAGFLEVFVGDGANWSFVRAVPGSDRQVAEVREKDPISDLCCTGLYHFARAGDFRQAFAWAQAAGISTLGEFYVAPLYNTLIAAGADIRYTLVAPNDVILSGTPDEYENFRQRIEG